MYNNKIVNEVIARETIPALYIDRHASTAKTLSATRKVESSIKIFVDKLIKSVGELIYQSIAIEE